MSSPEIAPLGGAVPATPLPGTPLVVRTRTVAGLGSLLSVLPLPSTPSDVLSWVRRGEGLVGWGEAVRFTASGPTRFADADAWWRAATAHAVVRDEVGLPGTGPVAFGSFPFADGSSDDAVLVVPEVVVGRRGDQWWLTTIGRGGQLSPAPVLVPGPAPLPPQDMVFSDGALTVAEWSLVVAEAVERITAGDLDKVVLARDLYARAASPIDPRWLLSQLAPRYDRTWTFSVAGLVGATPELLVRPGPRPGDLAGAGRHHPAHR